MKGKNMKITVVGPGRWGSCIAWYCAFHKKHDVTLYGLAEAPEFIQFKETGKNEYITLPESIRLTSDLSEAIKDAEIIIVSIGAQHFRGFLKELSALGVKDKKFVLCMKGLECSSGKRLTEIFNEEMDDSCKVAVWVGPGHVQDYYAGRPSCMIISSDDIEYTKWLVSELNSTLIRFYYNEDLIGCEIGAAAKNVMGIAAGMLDGIDCEGLKGALMARGAREISRLVKELGGEELTVYGLSHLGDYQATLFSEFSHNRMYGEKYIKGEKMSKLAEGVDTSAALVKLSDKLGVDLPISRAVYEIIFEEKPYNEVLGRLFDRDTKFEF
jgi:glycerol-3-phosphate dehydrogenase (NAD(P)+)